MAVVVLTLGPGWERFQRVLRDPQFMGKPRSDLLFRAKNAGLREAKATLRGKGSNKAHTAIRGRAFVREGRVVIRSLMNPERTQSLEHGQSGVKAIVSWTRWAMRTGHPGAQGIASPFDQPQDNWPEWSALMNQLESRQPPVGMFVRTGQYWRENVPRYLEDIARKIERDFIARTR